MTASGCYGPFCTCRPENQPDYVPCEERLEQAQAENERLKAALLTSREGHMACFEHLEQALARVAGLEEALSDALLALGLGECKINQCDSCKEDERAAREGLEAAFAEGDADAVHADTCSRRQIGTLAPDPVCSCKLEGDTDDDPD